MIVKVIRGHTRETEENLQRLYLKWFKELLEGYGLDIQEISSEGLDGGPITLILPNDTTLAKIESVFLEVANSFSNDRQYAVVFELEIESEPIKVVGELAER